MTQELAQLLQARASEQRPEQRSELSWDGWGTCGSSRGAKGNLQKEHQSFVSSRILGSFSPSDSLSNLKPFDNLSNHEFLGWVLLKRG